MRATFAHLAAFFILLCIAGENGVFATTFTLLNKCKHPVWPGIQPSAGKPVLANGGFQLRPLHAMSIVPTPEWSGRIWGRHGCSFDSNGKGLCATGDCGGQLSCNGAGGVPPATLAEFTLGTQDFYDVSLVDGYNLPIAIAPHRGSGKCTYAGCISDLNLNCPPSLQVKNEQGCVMACKSACFAFSTPQYCCTGSYGNPQTCRPTSFSRLFKNACPRAYSYAYDDPSSLVTCSGADYLITFCPHQQ